MGEGAEMLCTLSISRNTHTHTHTYTHIHTHTHTYTLCWPSAERVVHIVTIVVKVTPSILFQELLEFAMQLEVSDGSCKLVAVCYIMEWYHRRLWGLGFTVLSDVPQMGHHVWYSCPICSVHKNIAQNTCCCNAGGETFTVQWSCLLSLVFAFAAVWYLEKDFLT